ncbi:hypothetical protein GP486_003457 [Trichoglossum hirsutum]|uniref:F-box domain-containing protein n=1 Tax=Trichoglossum hirsutum TaxID=265104 RepID=A0A9P8LD15_9PEZI|nr:hypothetical protein GP486_003457 [Trichoglossum hirsutum]
MAGKTPYNHDLIRLDPFLVLPIELAQVVTTLLDFKSLVLCLRVCKHWNRFLSSLTPLWRDLDLSLARKAVSERAITSYIRRSKGSTTNVLISQRAVTDASLKPILSRIATTCKEIKRLEIRLNGPPIVGITETIPIAQSLTTLILHCVLRFEAASMVMALCPNLVHAEFHQVQCPSRELPPWPGALERIRTFYLCHHNNRCAHVGVTWLLPFLDLMPNIRELTLIDWRDAAVFIPFDYSGFRQLESLALINCGISFFPSLPPTVRQLRVGPDVIMIMGDPESQANLAANSLSQLKNLSLKGIDDLKVSDIMLILSHLPDRNNSPLRALCIDGCLDVTSADLILLLASNATENLAELSLVNGVKVEDELAEIISEMKYLEHLDLSECPGLTGTAVKTLVNKSGKPLKRMNLNQCKSVGFDAVEMARESGVQVDFLVADWLLGRSRKTSRIP